MNCKLTPTGMTALILFAAVGIHAGPVTTVPWNGYTGAASFGYDDARESQLTAAVQQQFDKAGVKATFFIANDMYTFPGRKSEWAAMAKKGHEIANHSGNHKSPTAANVADMARTLRGLDPVVEAVTYAYPDCKVTSDANAEAFLARGCQFNSSTNTPLTYYSWATEPNWMNIAGLCIQPGNASRGTDMLDGAKSGNSWAVIFTHDVMSGPDTYSTTPSDHQKILDRAVANKLWIGTYQEVGAYYRAHFTMDKVTAPGTGPWNLTWTSPHAKMPKSVKLKVKLDTQTFGTSFTVSQDNVTIPANSDGSYTVDFMKLKMNVTKGSTGVRDAANRALSSIQTNLVRDGISLKGLTGEVDASLVDPRGTTLFHGTVTSMVPFDRDRVQGIVVLRLTDRATGAIVQRTLNTIH